MNKVLCKVSLEEYKIATRKIRPRRCLASLRIKYCNVVSQFLAATFIIILLKVFADIPIYVSDR